MEDLPQQPVDHNPWMENGRKAPAEVVVGPQPGGGLPNRLVARWGGWDDGSHDP